MEIVFSIGMCLILLVALLILIVNIRTDNPMYDTFMACIFHIGLSCIIISAIFGSKPTAIDVYRGNTTLEITYRDSIPVDSVVVFKKEIK